MSELNLISSSPPDPTFRVCLCWNQTSKLCLTSCFTAFAQVTGTHFNPYTCSISVVCHTFFPLFQTSTSRFLIELFIKVHKLDIRNMVLLNSVLVLRTGFLFIHSLRSNATALSSVVLQPTYQPSFALSTSYDICHELFKCFSQTTWKPGRKEMCAFLQVCVCY